MVEYPKLARLSRALDWFHEFLNLINGWVLWVGLAIALMDLLTQGGLMDGVPWLVWVWAASQAVGVDAFIYHWSGKSGEHIRAGQWKQAAFTLLVVGALAFVAWQAGYVFNFRELEHASVNQAISALGWTANQWLGIRAGISVAMVILSGLTRYEKAPARATVAPVVAVESVTPQPQIAPTVLAQVADVPADADETPYYREPNGEWEPILQPADYVPVPDSYLRRPQDRPKPPAQLRNPGKRGPQASKETQARKAWHHGMKPTELRIAAGISQATAEKYAARFEKEYQESEAARTTQTA